VTKARRRQEQNRAARRIDAGNFAEVARPCGNVANRLQSLGGAL
jgi:hypothetical protein